MHDAGVVEHDIDATPCVDVVDNGLDIGFLGDIALLGVDLADHVGRVFLGFGDGLLQSRLGDVGHQDRRAFAKEEDGRLEADSAARG